MRRSTKPAPKDLLKVVNDTLRLLEKNTNLPSGNAVLAEPLPGLYQQCLEVSQRVQQRATEPVRTVHHFACTGGTLISKYLAATPNTRLMSEVDPLSPLPKLHFSPSDLIMLYRNTIRPVDDAVVTDMFTAGVAKIHARATQLGERLVLRDHTHSHFCTQQNSAERPTLRDILAADFPLRSVVTVRHPLDSFLALRANGWIHFEPQTLDAYAQRYLTFLDAYTDVPIVTYEAFVADPEATLKTLCDTLDLAYVPDLEPLTQVITLTGDSGRTSSQIEARDRREIPPEVDEMRRSSPAFQTLCQRLGYDPV